MVSNYLVKFLEEKEVPTITKKRHTYLTYYGLEQQDTYVLKEGIVKTSIILRDGREFNISYIKGPDIEYSTHLEPHRPALRATYSII